MFSKKKSFLDVCMVLNAPLDIAIPFLGHVFLKCKLHDISHFSQKDLHGHCMEKKVIKVTV